MSQDSQKKVHRLGVIGAGTMGSGIALLGLRANMPVILNDVSQKRLDNGAQYIKKHLERKGQDDLFSNLKLTTKLEMLSNCTAVIEAAPENLDSKKKIFTELEKACPPETILASNTSTLPITAIAAASQHPNRFGGMHFFNPAPILPLVEVVKGAGTSEQTLQQMVQLAEQLGKTPVVANDSPGFIVNRVARPYYGEALRLVSERIATHEQVDQIMEHAGGFRMGPFRLMDLIGIDINFTAMKSMYEQTFGDKRYQPSLLQLQKIQENALGKKSGRGFYDYASEDVKKNISPNVKTKFSGTVYISPGTWSPGIGALCRAAGITVDKSPGSSTAVAIVTAGKDENSRERIEDIEKHISEETLLLCQAADATIHETSVWMKKPESLVGFDGLFFSTGLAATLAASPVANDTAKIKAESFVQSLGKSCFWINDGPALVVPRTVAMLANEAPFAIGEGLADAETIDKAMQLGVNYPQGPMAWAAEIGFARILAILDHLQKEYGEERYRAAPYLRRIVRQQQLK
ncbi:MAG: 3-hydroxyacyl-CoA dehydrogenase NAD-binding domain-containing protein [bacterium]